MLLGLLLTFALTMCNGNSPSAAGDAGEPVGRLLVFSKTSGYRHESIPDGVAAIQKLGQEHQVAVTATEDASYFVADSLRKFKAVVFLNTTHDVLNPVQQIAFEKYIQGGGGFVGIHAASDTEYDWPWYNRLVGAYFDSHPQVQQANIELITTDHPATAHLPAKWERTDEWYNFKNINPEIRVLAKLDESSYQGGKNGEQHPIAWYHEYDGGRAFYTGLGHTPQSYSDPLFLQHIWGGIRYAMGE